LGPRRIRLFACAVLTGFQLINAATANYGFFCYLAATLHVFLLDDGDLERAAAWLRRRLRLTPHRPVAPAVTAAPSATWKGLATGAALLVFVAISTIDGLLNFVDSPRLVQALLGIQHIYGPWRVINTYHLFSAITVERIEPEVQTFDGDRWTAHDFRFKPGDVHRPPPFVAPHQPRVDFRLWFYGLGFRRRGQPEYVGRLLDHVCRHPLWVQSLFTRPLPREPEAVRLVYWQYHFTSAAERRQDGAWWARRQVAESQPIACATGSSASELEPDDED
jgi:hypothetical protein